MSNEKNLIRSEDLTPEERRANASKAGKASVAARRKRKQMRTVLNELLLLPPDSPEAQEALQGFVIDGADNQAAVLAGLLKRGMTGDPKAVQEILRILGESRDTAAEKAERKARTEKLKADAALQQARLNSDCPTDIPEDGFLTALEGAAEDWTRE